MVIIEGILGWWQYGSYFGWKQNTEWPTLLAFSNKKKIGQLKESTKNQNNLEVSPT